jgi:hypothetical protein
MRNLLFALTLAALSACASAPVNPSAPPARLQPMSPLPAAANGALYGTYLCIQSGLVYYPRGCAVLVAAGALLGVLSAPGSR